MCFCLSSNAPPREAPPKVSPEAEPEVVPQHERKLPSGSRAGKRSSNMRPDTGESTNRKGQKKKAQVRTGVSPQIPSNLSTMPEDQATETTAKEDSEIVK